ncbi:protease inhibitor I42 family protein [Streptomyces sp. NRRL S-337]|uniref:protease inhibitor I42 family protein n=1 Tax=Streptomyces sp. NRRL S-337 TaxID=1463900 RepID=UPI000AF4D315|nr:protease inhibitor I42 family protein [Streptomyces sp. NRRL S-337]
MENSDISRGARTLVIVIAIAALLIALHSVFSQLSAPKVYGPDDTEIAVSAGEHFSVEVADDPAGGFRWIVAVPRPDPAVLRSAGGHEARGSAGPARYLDFEAVGPGRTDLRLVRCRRCSAGAADEPGARVLNFRVTVG